MVDGKTTVEVQRETLRRLRSLEKHPRESNSSIIARLLEEEEKRRL